MRKMFFWGLLMLSFACLGDENIPDDYIPANLPVIPAEAHVTASQSREEGAVGTTDPYGDHFDSFIFSKYPDIKKQKFIPDSTMKDDEETLNMFKTAFYRAMYFSKLITLSNGDNLYEFLTKCAKLNRTVTSADREQVDSNEFNIQYLFELKKKNTGELVGETLNVKRHGNRFSANRLPFAYFALSDKDFMKTYGLECAK